MARPIKKLYRPLEDPALSVSLGQIKGQTMGLKGKSENNLNRTTKTISSPTTVEIITLPCILNL